MSLAIETLNTGVENFGIFGSDTDEIHLGELPWISLEQFCAYGTDGLIDLMGNTTDKIRAEASEAVIRLWNRFKDYKVTASGSPIIDCSSTYQYQISPFSISPNGTVGVAESYVLSHRQFAKLVLRVMEGGLLGWDDQSGIPQPAHEGLKRLYEVISSQKS